MGTPCPASSEISVLEFAINRLDQKDFRFRLRSALAELEFDQDSLKMLKTTLNRWALL